MGDPSRRASSGASRRVVPDRGRRRRGRPRHPASGTPSPTAPARSTTTTTATWPATTTTAGRQDLDLIRSLGVASYRFSVAWSRVMPDGRSVNQAGLDFYKRLVDEMLERGIRPLMTLYHWDLPRGARRRRRGRLAVARPARPVRGLRARARQGARRPRAGVTTLNEPWCSAYLGYATGEHAPGRTTPALAYRAAHHLNLAHGRAVTALRDVLPATVGSLGDPQRPPGTARLRP